MSFRDDADAMRARIDELERELERVVARSERIEAERDAQREKITELERELAVLKEDPKVAARMKENARRTKEREEKERREREQADAKRETERETAAAKRRQSADFTPWLKILGGVLGVGVLGFVGYEVCAPPTWGGSHAAPSLGLVDLGTTPNPAPIQGTASGERSTPPGCSGSIPAAPQLVVRSAAPSVLSFAVQASGDTVLVVLSSDGSTYCDDDSGGSSNPALSSVLPAGEHRVWVGTYSGEDAIPFTLAITTAPAPDAQVDSTGLAPTATPTHGEQRPTPMPTPFAGTVMPVVHASEIDDRCRGYLQPGPSLVVPVEEPSFVRIDGVGSDDLVLFVEGPDGTVWCDDDGGPGTSPMIAQLFEPGSYRVWIGTYAARTTSAAYTLVVRGSPRSQTIEPAPRSFVAGAEIALAAGVAASRDDRCNVLVPAAPSAVLDLEGYLDVTVRSAQPGTILRDDSPTGVRCLTSGTTTWSAGRHRVSVAVDLESGAEASDVTLTAGAASLVPYAP
ncbi:MAG: hypothetical protein J0L92_26700 [Deltaproteobacteria bacterium]|nr:hypothetical protein [Deltaproteobacteria bacterium]